MLKGSGGHQGLPQSPHQERAPLDQPFSIKVQVRIVLGSWQEVLGCIGTSHLSQSTSEPPGRRPRSKVGSKDVIGKEGTALARVVREMDSKEAPCFYRCPNSLSSWHSRLGRNRMEGDEPH